jgi:hypothetical protein
LLACLLYPGCYGHNPGYREWVKRPRLRFGSQEYFKRTSLDELQALFRKIAKEDWSLARLEREGAM